MHSPSFISFYLENLDFCSCIHVLSRKFSISEKAEATFGSGRWRPSFSPQVNDYFRTQTGNHIGANGAQEGLGWWLVISSSVFLGEIPDPNCFFRWMWMRDKVALVSTTSFYYQRRNRLGANPKLWMAEQKETKETGFLMKLLSSQINHSPCPPTSGIPVMWTNKLPYCLKPSESASLLLALETILTDTTTLSWFLDVTSGR